MAFNKLGYKTVYGILDAVNYGVPQFRERFVLIGSRDNEDIFLPIPTHFQMHQNPDYRWKTVGEVIKDLENDPGEYTPLSGERKKYLHMVPEGGNWRDLRYRKGWIESVYSHIEYNSRFIVSFGKFFAEVYFL